MRIYIYVKTHRITGLKYLGKTIRDPYKYKGSGVRWSSHLKKYGNLVDTEILKECKSNHEVKTWGLYYSDLWDVANNPDWANLKPEEGDGGGGCPGYKHTEESKQRMRRPKSDKAKENMRNAVNPKGKGGVWFNNGIISKCIKGDIPTGWVKGRLEKPVPPSQKNKIWINDGTKSKMVTEIEPGWALGRLYQRK